MTTTDVGAQGSVLRIQTLESQTRRWKLTSLLLLLILAASLTRGLMAQGRQPQNRPITIEAQTFLLKDGDGNVRGQLSMKGDKPALELYDQAGKVIWSTSPRVIVPSR